MKTGFPFGQAAGSEFGFVCEKVCWFDSKGL
jgi:hypothetical protein